MCYLERRFRFFESDFYVYNTKYSGLGSAVFDQMIREAAMLTATGLGVGASHTPKSMLVYDSGWALYLFEGRVEVPRDLLKYVADGRQYLQQPGRDMCVARLVEFSVAAPESGKDRRLSCLHCISQILGIMFVCGKPF